VHILSGPRTGSTFTKLRRASRQQGKGVIWYRGEGKEDESWLSMGEGFGSDSRAGLRRGMAARYHAQERCTIRSSRTAVKTRSLRRERRTRRDGHLHLSSHVPARPDTNLVTFCWRLSTRFFRASTWRIAVIPYYGYARAGKEGRAARRPITAKLKLPTSPTTAGCKTGS